MPEELVAHLFFFELQNGDRESDILRYHIFKLFSALWRHYQGDIETIWLSYANHRCLFRLVYLSLNLIKEPNVLLAGCFTVEGSC